MDYRGHELSANVSMLFTELPYPNRYAAAAEAGFRVVESWWPFAVPDPSVAEIDDFVRTVESAGVSLGALNFYGGDVPGGERGVASHPDRQDELAANIRAVVAIARVQLADSPGRGEPGSGSLPIDATLDALKAAGYQGVAACEYKPTTDTIASLAWI